MSGSSPILTQTRVAEINERISRRGWVDRLRTLWGGKSRATSRVYYPVTNDRFAALQASLRKFAQASDIRYAVGGYRSNENPKSYGGFSPLIEKSQAYVGLLDPPFIDTNASVWGIQVGTLKVLFFPDTLLVYELQQYQAVPYASLSVSYCTLASLDHFPPRDAETIGYTWRRTNIDGGPDRRYSSNQRLPITLYGIVGIRSSYGYSIRLFVANKVIAANFVVDFYNNLRLMGE